MAQKLSITNIEFEDIKTSLKEFLRSQTTFKDYDFEGSSLNILISLLAYNTYYSAFLTNMVANEMVLDTATIRDSILAHAKSLNYVPTSRRAARALVDVQVTPPGGNTQTTLSLDRFTQFESEAIDGVNYTFVNLDAQTSQKENGVFLFRNVALYEGTPQTSTFTYDPVTNARHEFELPDNTVDTSTLGVLVQTSSINTATEIFTVATDISALSNTTPSFFLSTTTDDKYKLVFGDGRSSKALSNGNIVIINYLTTQADQANRANGFATGLIGGFSNVQCTSISAAAGGSERETDLSIKFNAPLAYSAQNRAVTAQDYAVLLTKAYPALKSVSVWGGEDNVPPVYDTVFFTYVPKEGVLINETEKAYIIDTLLKPLGVVTVQLSFVDPDPIYLKFRSAITVNQRKTSLNTSQIKDLIRATIESFTDTTLDKFNTTFASSKLESVVDNALPAIIGSDTKTILEKRITPTLNAVRTYTVEFKLPLQRSTVTEGLSTTGFTVNDSLGIPRFAHIEEVFDSFTGIDALEIVNPGFGYTEAPTVTITGDGTGATAEATIVNGRINSLTVLTRGTGYTTATVSFTGGNGQDAEAATVIAERFGTLRLYYNKSNAEKETINPAIGEINYETGTITLRNLKVISTETSDETIRFRIAPEVALLTSKNNQLLTFDKTDVSSLVLDVYVQ